MVMRAKSALRLSWLAGSDMPIDGYYIVYGNGGEGEIDYATPLSPRLAAWPDCVGFGEEDDSLGYGLDGYGLEAYGFGDGRLILASLSSIPDSDPDGTWEFAVLAYDAAGNVISPAPVLAGIVLAGVPRPPTRLEPRGYDEETDTLTLRIGFSPDDG